MIQIWLLIMVVKCILILRYAPRAGVSDSHPAIGYDSPVLSCQRRFPNERRKFCKFDKTILKNYSIIMHKAIGVMVRF